VGAAEQAGSILLFGWHKRGLKQALVSLRLVLLTYVTCIILTVVYVSYFNLVAVRIDLPVPAM